jgi:RHS repeat-associated protein
VERTYDSLGRPITQQAPDGGVTRRGYDAAGHITSVSDPLGHATHYEYDAAGRPTRVTDARGGQTRSEYDGNGYVTAIIDPVGVRTEFDRDAKGRPTAVRFAGGATSTMAYDGNGRLTSRVDPLGNTTTWAYDATGMLQQVTDALGQTTSYERNEEGSITKITEANGAETRLVNDRFRRMVQQTLPLGQTEDRTYDVSGHLVARTDFAGQTSSFAYDAGNGFLTNRTAEDGTTHAFTYSTAGQITSATNENGTWHYQYDAMGRYSRVTEPDGRQVSYTYDLAGRLTAITTPTGTTRYTYDELDRLTGMTDPLGRVTTWTYDAASRLTGSTHANGTTSEYTYDARGLLAAIAHRDGGGTVLFGEIYTRDLRGRITQVERNDGSRVQYAYNAVGWLTSETVTPAGGGAAQTTSYTYDAVGNRTAVTDASGTRPVTCDANGRLFSDGIYTYTYDDNGNVTRRSSAGETLDFAYDGFGKLVRVTRTGGTGPRAIEYRYDPMGALVARVADGVTEKYLVDRAALFHRVLEESDGGGTVTARNFFGVGPELREVGGAWIVLHGDHLSSTRLVTGPTGGLGSQYDYDAFGNLRAAVADNNPYRFAGERYDAGTGAIDLRARFYWPNAGRFLQMDPAAPDPSDQRTIHRYLYASNDPVNLVDPSGRQFDLGSVLISLSISINMMQSFFKYEAIALFMVFAMAGGLEIFDFPAGGPDGSMESRGGAQAFGLGLAVEVWNFNKVPHGRAAFAYAGVSLPFDILSANVGVGEFYVWESRTPNNYEGAFMAFVFSASYLTQVKSRFPRLPVGVGIQGSFEMFFSPIPSADIDESSPTFATYLQSHGIGLGISAVASYGGRGVGGGIGWSFTDYWIIWAQSEKYCKSTRYNRIFGEQTEFDPPR